MSHRLAKHTLMVLAPLLGSVEFEQPGSPKDEKAIVEEFRAFAKKEAASYTFRLEGSDRPLRFHPESVLSYTDPRGTGSPRRRLHMDGRREAGGGGRDLPVLHEGPPPGRCVPHAVAGQADRRTGGRRRLVSREAGGGVESRSPAPPPRPTRPPTDSARCVPWRGSSPAARLLARGWTAPCACSPSPSIATRTPRAT